MVPSFIGECILGNAQIYVSCGAPEWKAAAMPADASASCLFAINCEDPYATYVTAIAAGCESIDEPTEQIWDTAPPSFATPMAIAGTSVNKSKFSLPRKFKNEWRSYFPKSKTARPAAILPRIIICDFELL